MIEGMLADDRGLSQLQKDVKWIEYDDKINLHDFKKVHVSALADHYTLRSILSPNTYMKMSRDSFFQALLKQNSDKLLVKAGALVAKKNEEITCRAHDDLIHVKGLPSSIDPNQPLSIIGMQ